MSVLDEPYRIIKNERAARACAACRLAGSSDSFSLYSHE